MCAPNLCAHIDILLHDIVCATVKSVPLLIKMQTVQETMCYYTVSRTIQDPHDCSVDLLHHEVLPRGIIFDMALDTAGSTAVTVGQDGFVRCWDVASGKLCNAFAQDAVAGESILHDNISAWLAVLLVILSAAVLVR